MGKPLNMVYVVNTAIDRVAIIAFVGYIIGVVVRLKGWVDTVASFAMRVKSPPDASLAAVRGGPSARVGAFARATGRKFVTWNGQEAVGADEGQR